MENNTKSLTAEEFIPILHAHLKNKKPMILLVTGNSMLPFIADKRDSVFLTAIEKPVKKGDIVMFRRSDGRCVLHRVRFVSDGKYYFIGDGQFQTEGPIDEKSLLAECKTVIRKGKAVDEKSFIWFFFKHVWLHMIPFRMSIIKLIAKIRH